MSEATFFFVCISDKNEEFCMQDYYTKKRKKNKEPFNFQ